MAAKVKAGGVYKTIVAAKFKKNGVYSAITALSAKNIGAYGSLMGAYIAAGIPESWRIAVTAAYDSGADSALTSALIGSETTKARPNYTIAGTVTRTVAVKVADVAAPGAMLSYVASINGSTVASAQSFDSTNGINGTWTALDSTFIYPALGNTTAGMFRKRQPIRIAAGATRWVRLVVTAPATAVTIQSVMLHQLQAGDQDAWVIIGASLEALGQSSLTLESAVRAMHPTRDPIVFMYASEAQSTVGISAYPAQCESLLGDIYRRVLVGNALGNDISPVQPIADDSQATLDAIRTRYDTILAGFGSKPVYACRTTYRAYDAMTPANPENGSLPYNVAICDPAVAAHGFGFNSTTGIPQVDMYSAAQFNRSSLTDEVHFGGADAANWQWARNEWARVAFGHAYTGAWPMPYVETLVAAAEISTVKAEAQYAVNSLPESVYKSGLQARLDAISVAVAAFAVGDVALYSFGQLAKTVASDTNDCRSADPSSIAPGTVIVADSIKKTGGASGVSLSVTRSFNQAATSLNGNVGLSFAPHISTSMSQASWFIGVSPLAGNLVKDNAALTFSGLPAGAYEFIVAASRNVAEDGLRNTTVAVEVGSGGGGPITYSAANPASGTVTPHATLTAVVPASGVVTLSFNRPDTSLSTKFGYLGAIAVTRLS